jgi:23S rRNA (adenine-N6)-dimethyltransferase
MEEANMVRKRIRLAQNFFRDRKLVASIVANSSVDKGDTVYEIGPGEGIITRELAERSGKVIAIEKDTMLAVRLRNKFRESDNVEIREGDFLRYRIKERKYKIFSNIPFNITAEVVKAILFGENPPEEAYLVVQKEAAGKFTGNPTETEVSVLAKPWFTLEVLREFRRTDFEPVPSVDVVFLHIVKREQPLVASVNERSYQKFVKFGFEAWKKDLKTAYKHVFTYEQWKRLSKNLSFPLKVTPAELKFEQWLGLFEYFLTGVIDSKKAVVLSR